MCVYEEKQRQIYSFLQRANTILADDPLFYGGNYITGRLESPYILFLSINPGHGAWDDIKLRKKQGSQKPFHKLPCKYIAEAEDGLRLASLIVEVVCGNDSNRLKNCSETYLKSYFATPNEKVLSGQLSKLPKEMRVEHETLSEINLDAIKPKHIVCIGWSVFDSFISMQGVNYESIETKYMLSKTGLTNRRYYARANLGSITVHGLIHLSGAQPSRDMLEEIKQQFDMVWKVIDEES